MSKQALNFTFLSPVSIRYFCPPRAGTGIRKAFLEVPTSFNLIEGQSCGIFTYFEEKSVGKSEGFWRLDRLKVSVFLKKFQHFNCIFSSWIIAESILLLVPRCTKSFAPIECHNYSLEALKLAEKQRSYRYLLVVSALLFLYLSMS